MAAVELSMGLPAAAAIAAAYHALRARAEVVALRAVADSDSLTGLANYRLLHARIDYELKRHQRAGEPLALIVLDLDGFKQVNEQHGHPAGDRLLREVAARLASAVRAQDTPARQGGDEFAVLAPQTADEGAARLVERIRSAIDYLHGPGASIGWAVYPDEALNGHTLIELADQRQRAVKRSRRGAAR